MAFVAASACPTSGRTIGGSGSPAGRLCLRSRSESAPSAQRGGKAQKTWRQRAPEVIRAKKTGGAFSPFPYP